MRDSRPRLATWSLGAIILLSLLIGGGTETSLITDAVIQIGTVVICAGILMTKRSTEIDRRVLIFPLLTLAFVVAQVMPLPIGWVKPFWPGAVRDAWAAARSNATLGFLTLNVAGGIGSFAYLATATLMLWTLASLSAGQLRGILPFIAVGVLANVFAAAMQMSLGHFGPVNHVLPYTIWAGFFANPNHFATLLAMSAPPLGLAARGHRGPFALPILGLVLLMLLADGSIAGVAIGFSVAAASVVLLGQSPFRRPAVTLSMLAAFAVLAVLAWNNIALKGTNANAGRVEFLRTALDAVRDSPILGTGFGAFQQSYPIYERAADISSEYVNHDHNDYMELLMGGGLVAGALIALYLVFFLSRVVERLRVRTALAASMSIGVVLVHSVVDYPLRTMAILNLFIYAHAVLFNPADWDEAEAAPPPLPPRRSARPNLAHRRP